MYDMINIFEVFLPQLLRYPNPTDPLNGEAAALMMREPKSYDAKVKGGRAVISFVETPKIVSGSSMFDDSGLTGNVEYVAKYATKDAADEAGEDSESEDGMSSVGSMSDHEDDVDDEVAGNMEEV